MATIGEALRAAVGLHQSGRLADAARIYQDIINADPSVADAWHLLGLALHQTGSHRRAVRLIRAAIERDGLCANYRDSLGGALRAAKDAAGAVGSHRSALALEPANARFLANLGNALRDHDSGGEAVSAYRRALRLDPGYVQALVRLGECLDGLGRAGAAEQMFARLVALQPDQPDHLHRLGVARLDASGVLSASLADAARTVDRARLEAAIGVFRRAGVRCGHPAARRNHLGAVLLALQLGVLDDRVLDGAARDAVSHLAADPGDLSAVAVVCYDLYRKGRLAAAARFFRKFQRRFPRGEGRDGFELVWSVVQGESRFFEALASCAPGTPDPASRRVLVAPSAGERPIVLVGCDEVYWRRFGAAFLASWRERAPSCRVHLHVVDPASGTVAELERLCADGGGAVSASVEALDAPALAPVQRKVRYACARFFVACDLLRDVGAPVVQVDVDAVFRADPGAAMAGWPAWDVSIMRDFRGRGPIRDFLAGFIAFNSTPAGRAYADLVARYIGWHLDRGLVFWMLDQAAPYCVHDHLARTGRPPATVWHDFQAFPFLDFVGDKG